MRRKRRTSKNSDIINSNSCACDNSSRESRYKNVHSDPRVGYVLYDENELSATKYQCHFLYLLQLPPKMVQIPF